MISIFSMAQDNSAEAWEDPTSHYAKWIRGRWKCTDVHSKSETAELSPEQKEVLSQLKMKFKRNGTVISYMSNSATEEKRKTSYEITNNEIITTTNGNREVAKIIEFKKKFLKVSFDTIEMTFEKGR